MDRSTEFLENHKEKCRCCFIPLVPPTTSIKMDKLIQLQFFRLTQLKLKSSTKKYSQHVCSRCHEQLEGYSKYRDEILWKQRKLYQFVNNENDQKVVRRSTRLAEPEYVVEIKQEQLDIQPESVLIKSEPEPADDFGPLDHLYESDEHTKPEPVSSDSSATPQDDFLTLTTAPRRKKKKKSKAEKRIANWHYCQHCDKKFLKEMTLKIHIDSIHFQFKNFHCEKCDFKTFAPYLLRGHIARVHERTKKIPSLKDQPKQPCPMCGLMVQNVSAHIRTVHTRPKNVFCDICGFGIYNLNRLRRHMFRHLSKETKRMLISFKCDICGATLHSKNSIKAHMENIHMQKGDREYKCFCGRSYKAESYLKNHQKSHEKTADYPCDECGKKFLSKAQLKAHMEIHERKGRKDYSCEICGGMYGSLNLLMRHKIFHTEPKHACKYCGKKFHRTCLVDRHVKRQHEVEEVPCQFCGKMLNTLSMTRHVKEFHSGLPRANCPIAGCNASFLRRGNLKDHLQRMHKEYLNTLTADERNALDAKISQIGMV